MLECKFGILNRRHYFGSDAVLMRLEVSLHDNLTINVLGSNVLVRSISSLRFRKAKNAAEAHASYSP